MKRCVLSTTLNGSIFVHWRCVRGGWCHAFAQEKDRSPAVYKVNDEISINCVLDNTERAVLINMEVQYHGDISSDRNHEPTWSTSSELHTLTAKTNIIHVISY